MNTEQVVYHPKPNHNTVPIPVAPSEIGRPRRKMVRTHTRLNHSDIYEDMTPVIHIPANWEGVVP